MAKVFRPPPFDLAAVLSQPHPTVDLKSKELEERTRTFLKNLTNFKEKAINAITERRKHQSTEKKKILEKTRAVEAETNQCKLKEIELVAQLEREKEERKDAELSVAAFKRQLNTLRDKIASVDVDIEQYRVLTQNLRREKNKERSTLSSYNSHVFPELRSCEERLSCAIEGVEKDRLLVRFSRIDPAEPEKEASFVIDIASETFKIITASPHLPVMPILVNKLNEFRDIYAFFRDVRAAYVQLLDPGPH
ncbi:hypothetical protein CVT26_009979 [Gymnopilus dilepis]|uniref:Kinetochore protein SPC25 n=1 Tax=Gymnopilus dilepis TaxID=231916 RepID=A0A409VL38_9AGAR|nr:hypothetical protein CVT26_009979 [Gymnopilus dilepis]